MGQKEAIIDLSEQGRSSPLPTLKPPFHSRPGPRHVYPAGSLTASKPFIWASRFRSQNIPAPTAVSVIRLI